MAALAEQEACMVKIPGLVAAKVPTIFKVAHMAAAAAALVLAGLVLQATAALEAYESFGVLERLAVRHLHEHSLVPILEICDENVYQSIR
jgi:hypothetical protein